MAAGGRSLLYWNGPEDLDIGMGWIGPFEGRQNFQVVQRIDAPFVYTFLELSKMH